MIFFICFLFSAIFLSLHSAFCISVFYYLFLFLHSAFLHSASCIFAFMLYVVRARHFYVCCACVFLGVVSALCFLIIMLFYFFCFLLFVFCSCIQYLHFVFLYFALLYLLPRWLCVVSVLCVVARDCIDAGIFCCEAQNVYLPRIIASG